MLGEPGRGFAQAQARLISPDEVADLLAGGQGVSGIAVGHVWQEVAGELATVTPRQSGAWRQSERHIHEPPALHQLNKA